MVSLKRKELHDCFICKKRIGKASKGIPVFLSGFKKEEYLHANCYRKRLVENRKKWSKGFYDFRRKIFENHDLNRSDKF